jgi:hypothetical protein
MNGRRGGWAILSVRAHCCLRPRAWLPLLVVALVALVLALLEPWPDGPVLLGVRGLGPRGITLSDAIVLAALVVLGFGWLRFLAVREKRPGASSRRRPSPSGRPE